MCNIVPWGGPIGRAAAALSVESTKSWRYALPIQGFGLVCMFGLAVWFGQRERKRILCSGEILNISDVTFDVYEGLDPALLRPKMFIPNLILIVATVLALIFSGISGHLTFMFAFALALAINYHKSSDQRSAIWRTPMT